MYLLNELKKIVVKAKAEMILHPKPYIATGDSEPIMDIRLLILKGGYKFIVGTPPDLMLGDYCGTSIITLDTDAKELLRDLLDDIEFQMAC